jgi:hypothetical protein
MVRQEGLGKIKKVTSNPRPSGLYHSALTTTLPCLIEKCYYRGVGWVVIRLTNSAVQNILVQPSCMPNVSL